MPGAGCQVEVQEEASITEMQQGLMPKEKRFSLEARSSKEVQKRGGDRGSS